MNQQPRPSTAASPGRRYIEQPQLGQVHTADGELDLSAIYVLHHGLRRDLDDFRRAVPATPLTDTQSWEALGRRWSSLTTALHHHTRVEDLWIWSEIERQLGPADGQAHAILTAMRAEHAANDALLDEVGNAFGRAGGRPDPAVHSRLSSALREAERAILAHLAHEETEALPLMQSYMSPDRWKEAQRAAAKEYGLADLLFAVPWSAHGIPADQFGLAFAHGGVLVRILLAITRGGFERRHRTAFRYLTEPI